MNAVFDPKLVEAVARAICVVRGLDPDDHVPCDREPNWCLWTGETTAALTALCTALRTTPDALAAMTRGEVVAMPSEPTREMWVAGADAVVNRGRMHHDKVVEKMWNAMLAASPYREPSA